MICFVTIRPDEPDGAWWRAAAPRPKYYYYDRPNGNNIRKFDIERCRHIDGHKSHVSTAWAIRSIRIALARPGARSLNTPRRRRRRNNNNTKREKKSRLDVRALWPIREEMRVVVRPRARFRPECAKRIRNLFAPFDAVIITGPYDSDIQRRRFQRPTTPRRPFGDDIRIRFISWTPQTLWHNNASSINHRYFVSMYSNRCSVSMSKR